MAKIHMETENVRTLARLLDQKAGDLDEGVEKLKRARSRLSGAWSGGAREKRFMSQYNSLLSQLDAKAHELQVLSVRVNREVDEWVRADSNGMSKLNYLDISLGNYSFSRNVNADGDNYYLGVNGIYIPGGYVGSWDGSQGDEFSWFDCMISTTGISLALARSIPYDSIQHLSYKGIGRTINGLIDQPHGGWVGQMDKLGHILKNPVVREGIPLGLGVASDLIGGDNLGRAIGSELIEFGIDQGIKAIPVVGWVYAGYQLGLGIAGVVAGGLEILGYTEEAVHIQNTIEILDFSDKIGDAVYDFVTNKLS